MNAQVILNSRFGVGLALGLARILPQKIGYGLAALIADWMANNKQLSLAQAVRVNQWVVSEGKFSVEELDQIVQETFRSRSRNLYEYYHYLEDQAVFQSRVEFSSNLIKCIELSKEKKKGIMFVCPHLGNFDLVGHVLTMRGLRPQILSYPLPPGGYQWQNRIRRMSGLDITPMTVSSMRKALKHLSEGGSVLTGVDRPLPSSKYRPRFFGRHTAMPVSYVRMAIKANIPVTVLACYGQPNGKYIVHASEPIPMHTNSDLYIETVQNAEAVLNVTADYIREVPSQWAMFYPVWPEALKEVPRHS